MDTIIGGIQCVLIGSVIYGASVLFDAPSTWDFERGTKQTLLTKRWPNPVLPHAQPSVKPLQRSEGAANGFTPPHH